CWLGRRLTHSAGLDGRAREARTTSLRRRQVGALGSLRACSSLPAPLRLLQPARPLLRVRAARGPCSDPPDRCPSPPTTDAAPAPRRSRARRRQPQPPQRVQLTGASSRPPRLGRTYPTPSGCAKAGAEAKLPRRRTDATRARAACARRTEENS